MKFVDTRYWKRTEPTLFPIGCPIEWKWRVFQEFWSGKYEPIEDEV